jgi:hypothetical protein
MNGPAYRIQFARHCLTIGRDWPSHPMGPLLNRVLSAKALPALDRSRGKQPGPRGRVVNVSSGEVRFSDPGELAAIVKRLAHSDLENMITWHAMQRASLHGKGSRK